MNIAIASGKGGTGKTTISCALALSMDRPVCLLDCDVEEPNSHFFINPEHVQEERIHRLVPSVDEDQCTGCGECGRVCQFSAIISLGKKAMVFNELCHSCGACARICPTGAIKEHYKPAGMIKIGQRDHISFISGCMDVGQAMSPPIIRKTLEHTRENELNIIDCPPGTSCPFVTAVKGCDVVLLVTEPTPFGLHDLKLAAETLREMKLPFAVAVNRCTETENRISDYCEQENIPLLLQIPEDRRVAEAYSRGEPLTSVLPELKEALVALPEALDKVRRFQPDTLLKKAKLQPFTRATSL